jgi:hypothetical protein
MQTNNYSCVALACLFTTPQPGCRGGLGVHWLLLLLLVLLFLLLVLLFLLLLKADSPITCCLCSLLLQGGTCC